MGIQIASPRTRKFRIYNRITYRKLKSTRNCLSPDRIFYAKKCRQKSRNTVLVIELRALTPVCTGRSDLSDAAPATFELNTLR